MAQLGHPQLVTLPFVWKNRVTCYYVLFTHNMIQVFFRDSTILAYNGDTLPVSNTIH